MYIQQLTEMVPPPSQNTVAVCNQITLPILNCSTSRLVTLLNVRDAPVQVSDIFVLTVSYMFNNVAFRVLFVPEKSTSFMSYIFYIIYISLVLIL